MDKNFFKYLSVSPKEDKWGLYITALGRSFVKSFEDYPQGRHPHTYELTWNRGRTLDDYFLVFISKGEGVFSSANCPTKKVEAGTCFFLYPRVWHRYKPEPQIGWEEYWVGFNGPFADYIMKNNFYHPEDPFIHFGLETEMLVIFTKMVDLIKSSFLGYQQQLAGLLIQLLGLIHTTTKVDIKKSSPTEQLIAKAKFLIQESFERPLDVEVLATELPMGYSAFRKQFKMITGESPHQYHQRFRLERAKELLTTTLLNINEIADQTGFESVYHFSKLFKAKTGVSPSIYRSDNTQFKDL